MTAAPPAEPTVPSISLYQVRTAADAATWLRHRATKYRDDAATEPSAVKARTLRTTGTTLDALAMAIGQLRDNVAAADELARLAQGYGHPDRDAVEPLPEDYRLVCVHVANTVGHLAMRMRDVTAMQRHRRTLRGLFRPTTGRSPDL